MTPSAANFAIYWRVEARCSASAVAVTIWTACRPLRRSDWHSASPFQPSPYPLGSQRNQDSQRPLISRAGAVTWAPAVPLPYRKEPSKVRWATSSRARTWAGISPSAGAAQARGDPGAGNRRIEAGLRVSEAVAPKGPMCSLGKHLDSRPTPSCQAGFRKDPAKGQGSAARPRLGSARRNDRIPRAAAMLRAIHEFAVKLKAAGSDAVGFLNC